MLSFIILQISKPHPYTRSPIKNITVYYLYTLDIIKNNFTFH
jgi:hypothetical protein